MLSKEYSKKEVKEGSFMVICSVLYWLIGAVHGGYLKNMPGVYQLGNYKHQEQAVRGLQSMIVDSA